MKVTIIGIVLAICGSAGCATESIRLYIDGARDLNGGRPVRMLVRAVDPHAYVSEPYQVVAQKVVTPDDSVLSSLVFYPGTAQVASVKKPGKSVAIYFFFTAPGARWKTLLDAPLPEMVKIRVEGNDIRSAHRL